MVSEIEIFDLETNQSVLTYQYTTKYDSEIFKVEVLPQGFIYISDYDNIIF